MKKVFLILGCVAMIWACSSSGDGGSTENNYDRSALLTNWADNIIVPAYDNYKSKVTALATEANSFTAAPTEAGLQTLRNSWLEAYKAYQYISIYNIGKAEGVSLKESSNTYPASASGIEANINSGTYNLTLFAQFDKQGFPALDYLINGLGENDTLITAFYTTNAKATAYRQYLTDVTARLKTNADAVAADWHAGFRNDFIANNGTSVSSSVNKTVN